MWEYKEDGNSKVQISHAGSPISSLVQLDRVQVINYLVSIHPPVVSFSRCFRRDGVSTIRLCNTPHNKISTVSESGYI